MSPAAPVWTAEERAHWRPRDRLTPSAWAAARRRIVSKDAAEPGPWRHERAPWAVEILDALGADSPYREVVFMKSARVAGTETLLNWTGWVVDEEPAPLALCYPTIEDAREYVQEELGPFLREHDTLATHLLGEEGKDSFKKSVVQLDHMRLRVVWATSARRLARWTARFLAGDEIDKWPPFVGRDADPISLFRRRNQTYGDRGKLYLTSTPTTPLGAIAREFASCNDRRYFHVPCPHCGVEQRLCWAQVKWPKIEGLDREQLADRVALDGLAWYECISCHGRIEERQRAGMVAAGRWQSEGYEGDERPKSERVGYHISALYSTLGITLHRIVATFLRALAAKARGLFDPFFEFVTQVLGEPFEDTQDSIGSPLLALKKEKAHRARIVPAWAGRLLTTVDTQKSTLKWLTCAWSRDLRMRVLDRGVAASFAELEQRTLGARYFVEGYETPKDGRTTVALAPQRLFIDVGGGGLNASGDSSRTHEVYQFALSRPGRVRPVKGWGGQGEPGARISENRVMYTPPGQKASPLDVRLLVLDTQALKDLLAKYLREGIEPPGARELLEIPAELLDADMVRELTAEKKVPVKRGAARVLRWEAIPGRAHDYWDCLVYQLAAAEVEGVITSPGPEELARTWLETAQGGPRRPDREDPPWVDGSGWWNR